SFVERRGQQRDLPQPLLHEIRRLLREPCLAPCRIENRAEELRAARLARRRALGDPLSLARIAAHRFRRLLRRGDDRQLPDVIGMQRSEEHRHLRAERRTGDVRLGDAEMIEERGDIVRMLFPRTRVRARREQLPAKIAADHAMACNERRHERLPCRDAHQSSVEEDERRTVAIDAMREHQRYSFTFAATPAPHAPTFAVTRTVFPGASFISDSGTFVTSTPFSLSARGRSSVGTSEMSIISPSFSTFTSTSFE